jgi:hypothetical protein
MSYSRQKAIGSYAGKTGNFKSGKSRITGDGWHNAKSDANSLCMSKRDGGLRDSASIKAIFYYPEFIKSSGFRLTRKFGKVFRRVFAFEHNTKRSHRGSFLCRK